MKDDLQLDEIEEKLMRLAQMNSSKPAVESLKPEPFTEVAPAQSTPEEPMLNELAPAKPASAEPQPAPAELAPAKPAPAEPKTKPVFQPLKTVKPEAQVKPDTEKVKSNVETKPDTEIKSEAEIKPDAEKQKNKKLPFFASKEKKEQTQKAAVQKPEQKPEPKIEQKPEEKAEEQKFEQKKPKDTVQKDSVQIVQRDRGVAISKYLEHIQASVDEIALKQNGQAEKNEIGTVSSGLESAYIGYVSRNLGKLNPVVSLNILYEISLNFKDGSHEAEEFKQLTERVMEAYVDCRSLFKLDERVKFKTRKKQLIKKMATLLGKWENTLDKKFLDEICAIKVETNPSAQDDFNIITANLAKGKDVSEDVREFCGFKLNEVAEPPVLKDKPFVAPTVYELLEGIYRESVELKCSILNSAFEAENEKTAAAQIQPFQVAQPVQTVQTVQAEVDLKPIKDEIAALGSIKDEVKALKEALNAQLKETLSVQLKALKDEIKSLKEDLKAAKAEKPKKAKESRPAVVTDDAVYNEILSEISQLKSELSDEIKNIK